MILHIETALLVVIVTYAILWGLLYLTYDAREPRAVDTLIPFIGPCFTYGSHKAIYTLRIPGLRMYVVNSTALILLVQRNVSAISFTPILDKVAVGLMGFSKNALDILRDDHHSLLSESAKINHKALHPGSRLREMESRAAKLIAKSLNLHVTKSAPSNVKLNEWLGGEVIKTAGGTMYGPHSPFNDSETIRTWYTIVEGFVPLLVDFLPQLTARKYVRARERFVKTFERYYMDECHTHPDASLLVKERYDLFLQSGMTVSDIARHEVGYSIAVLINTIQATFWLVYHLFSDPTVLEDCRRELSGAVRTENEARILDMAYIKTSCPVFLSTFKETMRFHGINVGACIIAEDTMIDDQYVLRKGSVLLIPSAIQHNLQSVWGSDASVFNNRRFVPEKGAKPLRHNPSTLRVFGGRPMMCPGRYFASAEILSMAALLLLRFDITPRFGHWPIPTVEKSNPGITFQQPDADIEVEVRARDSLEWEFTFSGKDKLATASKGYISLTDI
ncbi:putative Cytochrome P450 [Seiridium cardinale]